MKKGYFLNGRYFSKTLSLSRFKRVSPAFLLFLCPWALQNIPSCQWLSHIPSCHLNSCLCRALCALISLLKASFCIVSSTLENHSSGSCYLTAGAQPLFCGLGVQSCEDHRASWVTGTQTWCHTSAFWAVVWNPSGVQYPAVLRTSTGTRLCVQETETVLCCHILRYLTETAKSSFLNSGLALPACDLKWTCVSVLGSSMKQSNYISTLLHRLDVSNILISQQNISEMWTFSM